MKLLILNISFVLISFKIFSQTDKIYDFDKYKIYVNESTKATSIKIENKGKELVYNKMERVGDGSYSVFDTLNLGNDNITDFLYIYVFDDSFVVGFLISEGKKFYDVELGQYLSADIYCEISKNKFERFYIGNNFVYVNVFFDEKNRLIFSKYSQKISFQQILKLKR